MYICPMHPDVKSEHPGRCPKCGMKLILREEAHSKMKMKKKTSSKDYTPLVVAIGIIVLTAATITFNDLRADTFALTNTIRYFMIGFFLTFSSFKLMDLPGFAQGYFTYDLLAKKWFS